MNLRWLLQKQIKHDQALLLAMQGVHEHASKQVEPAKELPFQAKTTMSNPIVSARNG